MLMETEMLMLSDAQGENTFRFDVRSATQAQCKKAVAFEESYSEVYGHQIFVNLDEIKQALK
jgi:hypothetical protein